eukprot:scaffold2639_cov361-Pavlova_lutheri.AAC.9
MALAKPLYTTHVAMVDVRARGLVELESFPSSSPQGAARYIHTSVASRRMVLTEQKCESVTRLAGANFLRKTQTSRISSLWESLERSPSSPFFRTK